MKITNVTLNVQVTVVRDRASCHEAKFARFSAQMSVKSRWGGAVISSGTSSVLPVDTALCPRTLCYSLSVCFSNLVTYFLFIT